MSSASCLVASCLSIATAVAAAAPPVTPTGSAWLPRALDASVVGATRLDMSAITLPADGSAGPLGLRHDGVAQNDRFAHLLAVSLGSVPRADWADPAMQTKASLHTDAPSVTLSISPLRLVAGAGVVLLLGWRRRHGRRR
jgi:hypothetical protein